MSESATGTVAAKSKKRPNRLVFLSGVLLLLTGAISFSIASIERRSFINLENRVGNGYEVKVPVGWNVREAAGQTTYYGGNDLETSDDAIIIGFSDQSIPDYHEYNRQDKEELLTFFKSLLQTTISADNGSAGVSYDSIETVPGSHPDAELALDVTVSGQNLAGTQFRGEGKMLVTSGGHFYFILVGSEAAIFELETDTIRSIVSDFVVTRL